MCVCVVCVCVCVVCVCVCSVFVCVCVCVCVIKNATIKKQKKMKTIFYKIAPDQEDAVAHLIWCCDPDLQDPGSDPIN